MDVSFRVLKEPRGFIRIVQCIMAILAFSTTAGFSTLCKFVLFCDEGKTKQENVEYEFGYPFSLTVVSTPADCADKRVNITLPYNLETSAEFFVATGVLSFLYTLGILVVYIFFHQSYLNNAKLPLADLVSTGALAIFWMAGSSAWAQGVGELKRAFHPETLFKFIPVCLEETHECKTIQDGSYGVLNASLVLGFANFLLWTSSLWFVYKETSLHTPVEVVSDPTQNQSTKPVGRV